MVQNVILRLQEIVAQIVAGSSMRTGVEIEIGAGSSAFAQLGQPGAKTNDEPLAQVKGSKQDALDPFQGRADRFGHADFPWADGDGSDGHKWKIRFL